MSAMYTGLRNEAIPNIDGVFVRRWASNTKDIIGDIDTLGIIGFTSCKEWMNSNSIDGAYWGATHGLLAQINYSDEISSSMISLSKGFVQLATIICNTTA